MNDLTITELEGLIEEQKEQTITQFKIKAWDVALMVLDEMESKLKRGYRDYYVEEIYEKWEPMSSADRRMVMEFYLAEAANTVRWKLQQAIEKVGKDK